MNLVKAAIVRLPDRTQDALMERLMKNGRIFDRPVWEMLFGAMEFMGTNIDQVKKDFSRMALDTPITSAVRGRVYSHQ